jgi:hypothetical protein
MDNNMIVYVVAAALILWVGLVNLIESHRTRRLLETALGPKGTGGLLGETVRFERRPLNIGGIPVAPGVSEALAPRSSNSAPGEAGSATTPVEPAQPQASQERETPRDPVVGPRFDLAEVRRALDEADQAQADQAPEPEPPARSGSHVAVAAPASALVLAPSPPLVAVALGERPDSGHRSRLREDASEPGPHPIASPPPVPRMRTLLGIPPQASSSPVASSSPAAPLPPVSTPLESAPVLAPGPAMVAAGLTTRPDGARSSRPVPHPPPRRRTAPPASSSPAALLPPAVPPPRLGPGPERLPIEATPGNFDGEETRVVDVPSKAVVQGRRARASTLLSMQPPPAEPAVEVAESLSAAGANVDEEANTLGLGVAAPRTSSGRDGAAS